MKIENVLLLLYADMEDPDMTPSRQSSLPLPQNNPLSLSLYLPPFLRLHSTSSLLTRTHISPLFSYPILFALEKADPPANASH